MSETVIVPRHVAMIPDGNRRWAKLHGKSVYQGHKRGVEIFEEVVRHAADRGVRYISIWGLSLDNLRKRSAREMVGLMRIFRREFRKLAGSREIHDRQIKIMALGRWKEKFPPLVVQAVEEAIDATKSYDNYHLNFFLAYNGTDDMLQAIRGVAKALRGSNRIQVTPALLKQHLFTKSLPPVDLLIRTAGEPHLSAGFMMWDTADAELYFTRTYWPDFTPLEFDRALTDFARRRRRLGT